MCYVNHQTIPQRHGHDLCLRVRELLGSGIETGPFKKATKEPETASDKYSSLLSMYEESQKENRALSAKVTSLERELADAVRQIRKLQATAQKIEKLAAEISVQ